MLHELIKKNNELYYASSNNVLLVKYDKIIIVVEI